MDHVSGPAGPRATFGQCWTKTLRNSIIKSGEDDGELALELIKKLVSLGDTSHFCLLILPFKLCKNVDAFIYISSYYPYL